MKALLDSPEKKVVSCDIGPLHYNGVRDGVYRMTRYLKKKASSSFFFKSPMELIIVLCLKKALSISKHVF